MNYCEFLLLSIFIVQLISPHECKAVYRPLSNAATQPFTIVKTLSNVATEPFTQITTIEGKQTVFNVFEKEIVPDLNKFTVPLFKHPC